MKIDGDRALTVDGVRGFLTNADVRQIRENVAIRSRGFRYHRRGTIGDRDFGTRHRFPNYPTTDLGTNTVTLVDGYTLFDPDTGQEHEVVVGLDANNNTRVYVHLGDGHTDTSSSAVATGTGSKTFTVSSGKSFLVGERILIARTSEPTVTRMEGRVTSYSGTTLVVMVTRAIGNLGPHTDWSVYGGWMELTRKVTALINDGAIGASDQIVSIDTIQENGVSLTPAISEFVGWIAVNKGQVAGTGVAITGAVNSGGLIRITATGHGLNTNDLCLIVGIKGTTYANGYWRVTRIDANTVDLQDSDGTAIYAYESGGFIHPTPSVAAPQTMYITENGAAAIETISIVGSNGMDWSDNDVLELYQSPGVLYGYQYSNGTTPHLRFNAIEPQRKVNVYYGSSASTPVMNQPVRVQNSDAREYFFTAEAANIFDHPARWSIEKGGGGLNPNITILGTAEDPYIVGSTVAPDIHRAHIYESQNTQWWGELEFHLGALGPDPNDTTRLLAIYITVEYDNYQQSDPVALLYCMSNLSLAERPAVNIAARINVGAMPKHASGLCAYVAQITQEEYNVRGHLIMGPESFKYFGYAPFNDFPTAEEHNSHGVWSATLTARGGEAIGTGTTGTAAVLSISSANRAIGVGASIVATLGHAPLEERAWLTPRFATRASRSQGGVVVVDKDDETILLSAYSGDGLHMDDVFPEVSVDVGGAKQMIIIASRGEMLGLGFIPKQSAFYSEQAGPVVVLKSSEIEIYDIGTGGQTIMPADVQATKSILSTPFGLVWGGKNAIYMIKIGGGVPERLNMDWLNLYDGTLMTEDGVTPFVTDAYRLAMIAGYDPTYRELWFYLQVATEDGTSTERLAFRIGQNNEAEWTWNVRAMNLGLGFTAKAFLTRKDGTMSVLFSDGILQYPVRTGTYLYQDVVPYYDTTAGNGIETMQRLSLGSLHSLEVNAVPLAYRIMQSGDSATGKARYILRVYRHGYTRVLDEQYVYLDAKEMTVGIERSLGRAADYQVEMEIPSAQLTDAKRWELESMAVLVESGEVVGTV